jgi:transcriptional regulator of NAD metabolism
MIKNADKQDTQIVGKALVKLFEESRKIIFKNITDKLNGI